ncbi:MAG: hypothetical protein ACFE0O_00865 [Opitutales bacterium]
MSSRYPLGRIHPHGSGGKSVYQRAGMAARTRSDGSYRHMGDGVPPVVLGGLFYFGFFFPPLFLVLLVLMVVEIFRD